MKTAKDVLLYLIPNADKKLDGNQYTNAINAIKGYCKQNIVIDRKKVADNATIFLPSHSHLHGTKNIDKNSIINAPNIELL